MGRIIPLRDDPHERVEMLLPWFSSGQLGPDEHDFVDTHLQACARCRSELQREARLRTEIAALPLDVSGNWARMHDRMLAAPRPHVAADVPSGIADRKRRMPLWRQPWAIAAQAACLMLVVALVPAREPDPRYHALGSPSAAPTGNLIVMFRPDTSEHDMRRVLDASGARVVDGPTAAGAYVLRVTPAARETALGSLRGQSSIVLAQPIDAGPRP
jgi:Putative zinc-finger